MSTVHDSPCFPLFPHPLQVLRAIIPGKHLSDLKASLPTWAYLYSRLVMDNNRGVRAEASHVMAALATALGREVAPRLRTLLPNWWLAQFDPVSEVATAASGGLQKMFPGRKLRDAMLMCRKEVGLCVAVAWLCCNLSAAYTWRC